MSSFIKNAAKLKSRYKKLKQFFREVFYYGCTSDEWIIDFILIPFVTINWKLEPTWFRMIAPPGSGKTAHLSLLDGHPLAYSVDEFTPKSFVSGYRGLGEDPSKVKDFDGKVLIISDESTLMEQRQEDRNLIMSLFRRCYDGKISKVFGNMKEKQEYNSYFNLLTGATPQIDRYFLYNQALGERFMNYRLVIPDREKLAEMAFDNQFKGIDKKKSKLKDQVHIFIDKLPQVDISDVKLVGKVRRKIIDSANLISLIRTHVTRDARGRHITTMPQPESAGRLVQQITQTAVADAIIRGDLEVKKKHIQKAIFVGLGAITSVTAFVLHKVYLFTCEARGRDDEWFSVQKMTLITKLGRNTVQNILEDLGIHDVLDIKDGKKKGGRALDYRLSKEMREKIESLELFAHYVPPSQKELKQKRKDRDRVAPIKKKIKRKPKNEKQNRKVPRSCLMQK